MKTEKTATSDKAKTATKKPAAAKSADKKAPAKSAAKPAVKASEKTAPAVAKYKALKGEEYMCQRQRDYFRDMLLAQKKALTEGISKTVHTMQDEATIFADPNDRASQETDIALELRNRDRERKLIKKIDETIARIDAEEYGYCDKCGVEIGISRLEARPTASLCIDCKTLDEVKEKQMAK